MSLQVTADLPEAFSVLGFAFYVQVRSALQLPLHALLLCLLRMEQRLQIFKVLVSAAHAAPPAWLVGYHGRVIMTLLAVFLVYPLCCLRRSGSHP